MNTALLHNNKIFKVVTLLLIFCVHLSAFPQKSKKHNKRSDKSERPVDVFSDAILIPNISGPVTAEPTFKQGNFSPLYPYVEGASFMDDPRELQIQNARNQPTSDKIYRAIIGSSSVILYCIVGIIALAFLYALTAPVNPQYFLIKK